MSPREKFLYLIENKEKLKGSEYDFINQKDEDHNLIPEEIERVEKLYKEISDEPSFEISDSDMAQIKDLADDLPKMEELLEDEVQVEEIDKYEPVYEAEELPSTDEPELEKEPEVKPDKKPWWKIKLFK